MRPYPPTQVSREATTTLPMVSMPPFSVGLTIRQPGSPAALAAAIRTKHTGNVQASRVDTAMLSDRWDPPLEIMHPFAAGI